VCKSTRDFRPHNNAGVKPLKRIASGAFPFEFACFVMSNNEEIVHAKPLRAAAP
jgi:hypothetical protein